MQQKDLNLWQRRWVKLIKDYDCQILYHPRKANMVTDALSQKSMRNLTHIDIQRIPLVKELQKLNDKGFYLTVREDQVLLTNSKWNPIWLKRSSQPKTEILICTKSRRVFNLDYIKHFRLIMEYWDSGEDYACRKWMIFVCGFWMRHNMCHIMCILDWKRCFTM